MLIKNLSQMVALSGFLVLATTSIMAAEEIPTALSDDEQSLLRQYSYVVPTENEALKTLQESIKSDANQDFINREFESMASQGYHKAVEWMLSKECPIKPNQESINWGLIFAARNCANTVVFSLMSQKDKTLKPDQDSINSAFNRISYNFGYVAPEDPRYSYMDEIIAILRPFATKLEDVS